MITENFGIGLVGSIIVFFLAMYIAWKLNYNIEAYLAAFVVMMLMLFISVSFLFFVLGKLIGWHIDLFYVLAIFLAATLFLVSIDPSARK